MALALPPLTADDLFNLLASTYNANVDLPANTDKGGQLGSIFHAFSMAGAELLDRAQYVYDVGRLLTSASTDPANPYSDDVDTFCAPWNVFRVQPVPTSDGLLWSSPSLLTADSYVPFGARATTADGLPFIVYDDPSNPNRRPQGYLAPAGTQSVLTSGECSVAGTVGRVQKNTVVRIIGGAGVPIPAEFTSVTNPRAFTNGADKEIDADLIARFIKTVSSGRVACPNAIIAAALAVQDGLTYSLGEYKQADGTARLSYFSFIVNVKGAGAAPDPSLISNVQAAISSTAVRACGDECDASAPTMVPCNYAGTVILAPNAPAGDTEAAVEAALAAYTNGIGLDPQGNPTTCSYARAVSAVVALPGVSDVTGFTINGGTANVVAPFAHEIALGSIALTYTPYQ